MRGICLIVIRVRVIRRLWPWLGLAAAWGALTAVPELNTWLRSVPGPLGRAVEAVVDRLALTLGNGT